MSLLSLLASIVVADSAHVIRVNYAGYLPDAPKVAVLCSLDSARFDTFVVRDSRDRVVLGPRRTQASGAFGPCRETFRLDFSSLRATGE